MPNGMYGGVRGARDYPLLDYSMTIKEKTRKLAAGSSKYCFEVADGS